MTHDSAVEPTSQPTSIRKSFLSRLTRVTSSGRFIPEIDGLRFVAISLVVLGHIHDYISFRTGFPIDAHHDVNTQQSNWLTFVLARANIGVPLFFVISGFILSIPFASHALRGGAKVDLRKYFIRRVTRLEPPYLIALFLSFAALSLFFRGDVGIFTILIHTLYSSVYLNNLITGGPPMVNIAFWSLEVEIQFYLVAPLLARLFWIRSRRYRRMTMVLLVLCVGMSQLLVAIDSRIYLSLAGQLQYFLAGMLLADIYVGDWQESPPPASSWGAVASLVGWPLLIVLWDERFIAFRSAIVPLLMVGLYLAVLRRSRGTRWLAWMPVAITGGMCYSIYLLHLPIIYAVGRFSQRIGSFVDNYTVTFLIHCVPFLLAIGTASMIFFVFVERPCMDRQWLTKLKKWLSSERSAG